MDTYDTKSCNALEKPYYQPIEAALRWCGLALHEVAILKATGDNVLPPVSAFPRWPCLRANAEKILEAMECGELTISRDGRPVPAGDHDEKLPPLLKLRYGALDDAIRDLGGAEQIRQVFVGFQRYLYESNAGGPTVRAQ